MKKFYYPSILNMQSYIGSKRAKSIKYLPELRDTYRNLKLHKKAKRITQKNARRVNR